MKVSLPKEPLVRKPIGKEVDWIQRAERITNARNILSPEYQNHHKQENNWTRLRRKPIRRTDFHKEFLLPELQRWFKVNVAGRGQAK